jgi:hypothetical protein
MMRSLRPWQAALLYAALALAATLPLLRSDQLLGAEGQGGMGLWATWYPLHALRYNFDLSYSAYAVYPYPQNWLPALSLPNSLLYHLLNPLVGSPLAYHLLYPLALWAAALTMFVRLRGRPAAPSTWADDLPALLGGLIFAFNPLSHALVTQAALPLLGLFLLPLWMLVWDSFLAYPTSHRSILLAGVSYLGALWSLQGWGIAASLLLPYATYHWYRGKGAQADESLHQDGHPTRINDGLWLTGLLLAILLFIFPASALLWSTYELRYSPLSLWWPDEPTSWLWPVFVGAGGLGLLIMLGLGILNPYPPNPLYPVNGERGRIFTLLNLNWPWLWLGLGGLNALFYLLPDLAPLTLLGQLFAVPNLPALTSPPLFGLAALTCGLLALQSLPTRHYLSAWLAGMAVLGLMSWLLAPPATTRLPVLTYHQTLADDPENYLVADLPLSLADALTGATLLGDPFQAQRSMAMASQHHKRLWGGVGPEIIQADYFQQPLSRVLLGQLPRDHTQIIEVRRDVQRWRTGYLIFWDDLQTEQDLNALRAWLTWTHTFCPVQREGAAEFWRAYWHPGGCPPYQIALGTGAGDWAIGAGWGASEQWDRPVRWVGPDPNAVLTLWAASPAYDLNLTLRAQATGRIPGQEVSVWVNGQRAGQAALGADWAEPTFPIPRQWIGEGGVLEIELRHAISVELDGRTLAAVYEWVALQPVP